MDEHEKSAVQRVVQGKTVPEALRHVLQELEARSLIDLTDGRPRLFAASFETFLLGETSRGGKGSLLKRIFGKS